MLSKMLKHFSKLEQPSLNRDSTKYYPEMQQLAYNLVRYLKMNEDKNEDSYQGNYNLTYLIENMSESDFDFVITKFLEQIPFKKLRELIKNNFSKDSYDLIFKQKELKNEILDLQKQLNLLKEKLNMD